MDQVIHDSIQYGTTTIEYDFDLVPRKTLGIYVHPNGNVLLKAPLDSTLEAIREKVEKKAMWILRQKRFFASFTPSTIERRYVSGESHLYLGRQYMLRIKESEINAVHYQSNVIEIECRQKKNAGILLQTWYRKRANIKFLEYAQPIIEQFAVYGVSPKSISIKIMQRRWGYCSSNGEITLNPRLICAPRCCIEYVITHEMCHLIYRNHNKKFYTLLTKEMPHWEKWKAKLERMLA
ncbi:MAG: M48 family metallopeptidase [Bacteroidaceae bacterium]|nr:M48 family metallopeptidase [Bacteroidaceae bacterium]